MSEEIPGDNEDPHGDDEREPEDPPNLTESMYNLRPRREHDYAYQFGFLTIDEESRSDARIAGVPATTFHYTNHLVGEDIGEDEELDNIMPRVAHHVMVQMSLKQGLREFGDRGREAVTAELQQIHMKDTFMPKHLRELTPSQRSKALESLIFLEEKRTGEIKGRMCADGRKQREWTPKEEAASPTIMTDSILLTSAMDAAVS